VVVWRKIRGGKNPKEKERIAQLEEKGGFSREKRRDKKAAHIFGRLKEKGEIPPERGRPKTKREEEEKTGIER